METRRKRCLNNAAGDQVPKTQIKQELERLAEELHAPDLNNQEMPVKMESFITIIKTEEYFSYAHCEAHVEQQFTPVSQTEEFIKTELILDAELGDQMDDSEANCKQNILTPAGELYLNAGSSTQRTTQHIPAPAHRKKARASVSVKETEAIQIFRCEFCPRTFQKSYLLKRHRIAHVEELTCDWCQITFSSKPSLRAHMKAHAGLKKPPIICEVCGISFTIKGNLKVHMVKKHLDTAQSNTPGQEITVQGSGSALDIKSIACEVCYGLYPKEYILIHKRLAHSKIQYKCKICSRLLKGRYDLEKHRSTHGPDRKGGFACDICERTFYTKGALSGHMKAYAQKDHPNNKEGAAFQCGVCFRMFKTKARLREHFITHSKDRKRNIGCDLCGKMFWNKRNLWAHKKVHKLRMLRRQHLEETQQFTPQPSNDAVVPMKTYLISVEKFKDEWSDGDSDSHAEGI